MAWHKVATRSEIPAGRAMRVVADGLEILICNVAGRLFAIEDVCTHDGGALDQGKLEGACIVCPRHGATFDVRTGEALTLPAIVPLMTFGLELRGDDVYVDA